MSGGGSQGYTTQRSSSSSEAGPPTPIAWALNDMAGALIGQFQQNPNAPAYYPGSTVAGFTPEMQSGVNALGGRLNYQPNFLGAGRNVQDTLAGKYLNLESNPYFQGALNASLAPQQEQFLEQVIPGITSAFSGSGRTGSGIHQQIVENATRDFNRAQADARTKAASDAYMAERGMMGQAAALAPTIASTASGIDLQSIQAALAAGQLTQQQAQAMLDADIQRYNYGQTAQTNYLTNLAQQLQAIYPGGSTQGSNYSFAQQMQPRDTMSEVLGGIMSGAGLGLSAFTAFSDERLKDVHRRVGYTDSGTPLYLYNYKGSTEPRIGPMAQHVMHKNPDAVKRHPSGYLAVDYRGIF